MTGCAGPIPGAPPPHPFALQPGEAAQQARGHDQGGVQGRGGAQASCLMAVLGPSGAGRWARGELDVRLVEGEGA